jgi:hypothetical protein
MSRRQARWMEELAIYDCKFIYVKGEDNTVADSLSRFPFCQHSSSIDATKTAAHPYLSPPYLSTTTPLLECHVNSPFSCITPLISKSPHDLPTNTQANTSHVVKVDNNLVKKIVEAFKSDPWCQELLSASSGMPNLILSEDLWFLDNRLIVPKDCGVREENFSSCSRRPRSLRFP